MVTVQAVDQFGAPISRDLAKANVNVPQVQQQSQIDIRPMVTKAPTLGEKYKQAVQERGYIKGTLGFIGGEIGKQIDISQQKASRAGDKSAYYQSEGFINLGTQVGETAPYFIPYVGESLLITGGAESIGREPTLLGKAKGVGELGLGIVGGGARIKSISTAREIKAIENTPLKIIGQRYTQGEKGVDVLVGFKQAGKSEYSVKVTQPFEQVSGTRTVLEGGQGTVYRLRGNKLTVTKFETGGRVESLSTTPTLIKGQASQEMKELQAGAGRVFTRKTAQSEINLRSGIVLPKGGKFIEAEGTIKRLKEPAVWQSFTGVSKEGKGYFDIMSGVPVKARYYPATGRTTVLSKTETVGRIMTKPRGKTFEIMPTEGNIITLKATPSAPVYTEAVLKQGISEGAPKLLEISKAKPLRVFGSSSKTMQMIEEPAKVKTIQIQPVMTKEETKSLQIPKQVIMIKSKERTRQITPQKSSLDLGEMQKSKERLISNVKVLSLLKSRQRVKQLTKQKSVQLLRTNQQTDLIKTTGKIPIRRIPKTSSVKTSLKKAFSNIGKGYKVLVRRKGRIESIGENLPLGRALELGVRRTKAGTEQTFALKEVGFTRMEDINFQVPRSLFAAPKRAKTMITPITFTELRGKTLTTKQEISSLRGSRSRLKWW